MTPPAASAATPWEPHTALVVWTVLAGLLMIAAGTVRLRLPTPRDSPYSERSIRVTYSAMIALGGLLVALAARWRFLP